jgi:acetyltransferase-like isoleucine patch superfamily enzyme
MNAAATQPRGIAEDWYPGVLPSNIALGEGSYVETSFSFLSFRSRRACGLSLGRGAALYAPTLDVGPAGRVSIGDFALISSAAIFCDEEVTIGAMTMLAWHVVVTDSYRRIGAARPEATPAATARRKDQAPRPVRIGTNVWLGFESCVLPGVTIGDGSVIGARSVVTEDVPANCIAAGNPARVVRRFEHGPLPNRLRGET